MIVGDKVGALLRGAGQPTEQCEQPDDDPFYERHQLIATELHIKLLDNRRVPGLSGQAINLIFCFTIVATSCNERELSGG